MNIRDGRAGCSVGGQGRKKLAALQAAGPAESESAGKTACPTNLRRYVTLPALSPGEEAVTRIWPGLPVVGTIAWPGRVRQLIRLSDPWPSSSTQFCDRGTGRGPKTPWTARRPGAQQVARRAPACVNLCLRSFCLFPTAESWLIRSGGLRRSSFAPQRSRSAASLGVPAPRSLCPVKDKSHPDQAKPHRAGLVEWLVVDPQADRQPTTR